MLNRSGARGVCAVDENGYPMPDMIAYYAEKARGGAAVVTLGDTPVDREHAASNPRSFCLDYTRPNAVLPYLSEIAMAIAEKVVGRELNAADQKNLVDSFIDGLGESV